MSRKKIVRITYKRLLVMKSPNIFNNPCAAKFQTLITQIIEFLHTLTKFIETKSKNSRNENKKGTNPTCF